MPFSLGHVSSPVVYEASAHVPVAMQIAQSKSVDQSELIKILPPARAKSGFLGVVDPRPGETPQAWGTRIAEKYLLSQASASKDILHLEFPLSDGVYYAELQNEIAKRFPKEAERPTIVLSLRNSTLPPERVIGLVGGLGPLADASLVCQVEMELNLNRFSEHSVELRLNSDPHPPRSVSWCWSYMVDIWNFMHERDINEFVLASNTAHIHMSLFNWLSNDRMFDGVNYVAQVLKNKTPVPTRILVLGTSSAYEHELYPKVLRELGLEVASPSKEEQKRVQQGIDLIKSGQIEQGRQILSVLMSELAKPPVSHVLLACTELPLAIDREYECEVVDTSAIFAKHIAERLRI